MTDAADHAQQLEFFARAAAIGAAQHAVRQLEARRQAAPCEDCGDAIEAERLAVFPGARRCLVCQEGVERLRRFVRSG